MRKTPRQLRIENGLKVEELAQYLGIHKSTYSRKERGHKSFTIQEALLLADLYGLSVHDIDFTARPRRKPRKPSRSPKFPDETAAALMP